MLSSTKYEHLLSPRKNLLAIQGHQSKHQSKRSLQLPTEQQSKLPTLNRVENHSNFFSQKSPQNSSFNHFSMTSQKILTEIPADNPENKTSEVIQTEQVYQMLTRRLDALNFLIEKLSNIDNQKEVQNTLKQLTVTLAEVSKNEILLTQTQRENEQRKMKESLSSLQMAKLLEKLEDLRKTNQILDGCIQTSKDENVKLTKKNLQYLKDNNSLTQQIKVLENRMTLILESDMIVQESQNNKLLLSLNQVLRENEQLKKETSHIKQDNQRFQGLIKTLEQNVQRLNSRITKYESKSNIPDKNNETNSQFSDIDLLQTFKIPSDISYKIMSQKINFQNLFYELLELGSKQLVKKAAKEDKDKILERLEYFSAQVLQLKEHSEKFNILAKFLEELFSKSTLQEVIIQVSQSLTQIFGCEYVKLWIIDAMTGIIYTYSQSKGEYRASTHKGYPNYLISNYSGLIADIFKYRRAANYYDSQCKKPVLYRSGEQEQPEYCKSCLLVPIFSQENILRGVLQISNSEADLFGFDEEYFAIIVAKLLEKVVKKILEQNLAQLQSKYFPLVMDAFEQLMQTQNQFEFQNYVKRWIGNIFGISNILFYFVEQDQLKIYKSQTNFEYHSLESGLVGMVARVQQGLIINNAKQSSVYNENVDMKSILPLYCIPLVDQGKLNDYGDEKTMAVIQLPLKSRFLGHLEKDKLLCPGEEYSGMDENIQKQILLFGKMVIVALKNIAWQPKRI